MPLGPEIMRRAHIVLLVILSLAKGAVWIGALPPLLVADEPAHFDDVQFRAETGAAPSQDGSGRPLARAMPNDAAPELRRLWSDTLGKAYYRTSHAGSTLAGRLDEYGKLPSERATKGQTTAMAYPGVYYRTAVPFYLAFQSCSIVTRI